MRKYNPFRPGSIVTPGMFKGRLEELSSIEGSLFQTLNGNPQNFLIEGERGIGKSSLMLFVEYLARGKIPTSDGKKYNFMVTSVELEGRNTQLDILRKLASAIKIEMSDRERLKSAARTAWEFLSNWEILGVKYHKSTEEQLDPLELLNQLGKVIEEIVISGEVDGILLLIDEADKPGSAAHLGTSIKLLSERLTKRDCHKVCFGLAGLPDLLSKLKESHESSPRLFNVITLEPLTPSEIKGVVQAGIKEANERNPRVTEVDEESLELISTFSEGYPHFIQQFSFSAFDQDQDDKITEEDVLAGAFKENGALSQLGHKYFASAYFDKINSDNYRQVLQAMASKLDQWITRQEIISISGLKTSTVGNALMALKERDIIIPSDAKDGKYRLPSKSFAVWIRAITSIPGKLRV